MLTLGVPVELVRRKEPASSQAPDLLDRAQTILARHRTELLVDRLPDEARDRRPAPSRLRVESPPLLGAHEDLKAFVEHEQSIHIKLG